MWEPNRAQWWLMVGVVALLVFAWPPDRANGFSLAVKAIRRAADPLNALPALPPPLPLGLGDNGDAVAAHDALEAQYFATYNASPWTRRRMALKNASDPFDTQTERQILIGVAVFGALGVWKLERRAR